MMNRTHFDYIIIGGGCAGLSLALSLSSKELNKTILILELRQEYVADRTWCFWNVQEHPFETLVEYSWKTWEVQWNQKKLSLTSSKFEYQCISSERFYQEATSQLKKMPNVTLLMNSKVTEMTERSSDVLIKTSAGVFNCATVFDSSQEGAKADLLQHFHGWKVCSQNAIFNPNTVTLMDFDVDQDAGLHFMYVLPYTDCCALVESTYLSSQILPKTVYENAIKRYMRERYFTDQYEILGKEQGVLPLRTSPIKKATKRIVPIGTNAGWARASTGYAFLAIQEGVKNLLGAKSPTIKKSIDGSLDQIFLSHLQNEPKKSPELFYNLFEKNSPDCLVRFLTSRWSYRDLFKVLLSMPKTAMIKQAMQ